MLSLTRIHDHPGNVDCRIAGAPYPPCSNFGSGGMSMDRRLANAFTAIVIGVLHLGAVSHAIAQDRGSAQQLAVGEMLPTGQRITPTAAAGAQFRPLIPIPSSPDFAAGQAVELAVSPDGSKMLALTSGYNRVFGADGRYVPERS